MKELVELKRQFLEHLKIERGRSDKTLENYSRYLERFLTFSKIKTVSQLTEEQIAKFQQHLQQLPGTKVGGVSEPMKPRTQNYYLSALRTFLTFLQNRGLSTISPASISLAPVPQRSLDLISASELKRLLAAPDMKSLEGKRDRAILELFFSTGLRISELCKLSVADVDLAREDFSVQGTGEKVRTVFISDVAKKYLKEYLIARKDTHDALFVRYGRKANDGGSSRLQPKTVQRLVSKYASLAGLARRVTPHDLRHSFAIDLLRNGADLRSVQALLGHTSIGTTQVYTKMTDTQLHTIHKKFHGT